MTTFFRKPIVTIEPLGMKLRQAREAMSLSLDRLAYETGVPSKFLLALEESHYEDLPGDVYVRNFLKKCSDALHLNEERVLELFRQERQVVAAKDPVSPPTALPEPRVINLPRLARNTGVAIGVLVLLLYLGLKVRNIIQPPTLAVTTPSKDLITNQYSMTVEGSTEPEATVRINGQDVFLDPKGHFSERIDLQPGLNVIKVSASRERSREQTVYRQVVVEQTSGQPTISATTEYHL